MSIILFLVGCTQSAKEIVLPEYILDFVKVSEFESNDWDKKAVEFEDRGIIGNEHKSGVIIPEPGECKVLRYANL